MSDGNGGFGTKDRIRDRYSKSRDMSKVTVLMPRPQTNPFDHRVRKRVVVYCRVSTDGISQTTSFELQKNYYLKWVRQNPDWKLVAMYCDEGLTATKIEKRDGLIQMLEDAKAGKFDIIVVKNLSRLSRNLRDCMNIVYKLRALPNPVGILFETENLFTLDKSADFTLQVLSLVAQEESHKKSEAMNASVQQRFAQGQYLTPAPLGFDNNEDGELIINEEEAKTVRLIFKMYNSGCSVSLIAETLEMLGRRTKTKVLKDGRLKMGRTKWHTSSIVGILRNERMCGDVVAQKSYTPDYLTHKSEKNDRVLPQYHAKDQHEGIISREEYELANRLLDANKGGWDKGLPELSVYEDGALQGCVGTIPKWCGYGAEDYNRAALRAFGVTEETLPEYEKSIEEYNLEMRKQDEVPATQYSMGRRYEMDSDDYRLFPDKSDEAEEETQEEPGISFASMVESIRQKQPAVAAKDQIGQYDFEGYELVRAQMFSTRGKACITLDHRGVTFNKACSDRFEGRIEDVEIIYNPLEMILIVRPAKKDSAKTLGWSRTKDGLTTMRHCSCRGIMGAVYDNMGWNEEYKYRVIGSSCGSGDDAMLIFYLEEPMIIAPTKEKAQPEEVKPAKEKNWVDEVMGVDDGWDQRTVSTIDPMDYVDDGRSARSSAIYYGSIEEAAREGKLNLDQLGKDKYDPGVICEMVKKGLSPQEGWIYLRGMAVFKKNSIMIFPEDWADSFGTDIYHSCTRKQTRYEHGASGSKAEPYGWTLGVDVPTREEVDAEIKKLKRESA